MTIKEFAKNKALDFAKIMFPYIKDDKSEAIRDKYETNLITWITELITEWEKQK